MRLDENRENIINRIVDAVEKNKDLKNFSFSLSDDPKDYIRCNSKREIFEYIEFITLYLNVRLDDYVSYFDGMNGLFRIVVYKKEIYPEDKLILDTYYGLTDKSLFGETVARINSFLTLAKERKSFNCIFFATNVYEYNLMMFSINKISKFVENIKVEELYHPINDTDMKDIGLFSGVYVVKGDYKK